MKKIDATKGPLLKQIIIYAIPIIITTIVQELFNAVDKAVLGNMADTTAVASCGATTILTNLITAAFIGLSSGTAIVLARYVGQCNVKSAKDTIGTALICALGFGALVAAIGIIFAPTLLALTKCPEECYDGAVLYLRLFIAGAPATLLYNYGSSILRTLGDTKSPMKFIMIGGVTNVILNVILCIILPQKVAAVAIATVTSNVISATLVLHRLSAFDGEYRISLKTIRFSLKAFLLMLKFGVPATINSLIVPISNLQIVTAINSFGVDAVAGNSAAISLQTVNMAFHTSFGISALTFIGQNIGAKNQKRVRASLFLCLIIGVILSGSIGVFLYLTGRIWLGLILGAGATEAIEFGIIRMFSVNLFCFIFAINNITTNSLQAYGYPIFSSISAIIFTLGFRTVWMQFIYPINPTFNVLMLCFTVTNVFNAVFCIVALSIIHSRYMRGIYRKI